MPAACRPRMCLSGEGRQSCLVSIPSCPCCQQPRLLHAAAGAGCLVLQRAADSIMRSASCSKECAHHLFACCPALMVFPPTCAPHPSSHVHYMPASFARPNTTFTLCFNLAMLRLHPALAVQLAAGQHHLRPAVRDDQHGRPPRSLPAGACFGWCFC